MSDALNIKVEELDKNFCEWSKLLNLLHEAFEYQKGRIDPPSSLYKLNEELLAQKALTEKVYLARKQDLLVGCVFAKDTGVSIYIGKLAVLPSFQKKGVGRLLIQAVENYARQRRRSAVELETRIELIENHEVFKSFGFQKVRETAHPGYNRATSLSMKKQIDT